MCAEWSLASCWEINGLPGKSPSLHWSVCFSVIPTSASMVASIMYTQIFQCDDCRHTLGHHGSLFLYLSFLTVWWTQNFCTRWQITQHSIILEDGGSASVDLTDQPVMEQTDWHVLFSLPFETPQPLERAVVGVCTSLLLCRYMPGNQGRRHYS